MVKKFRPEYITNTDGTEFQACMVEPDFPEDMPPFYVLASDYAALEARLRDYEDMLRRVEGSSRPHYEPAWQYYEIRELLAKYSTPETACEHEWEPVKVTGDNGVIYNCKKCGGTKGWNPGAAIEHWESVPNRGAKP